MRLEHAPKSESYGVDESYNKRREDFASDREYDDFLEEVEDITFNLLNDIDVEKTEARMREYTNKNSAAIAANKKKAAKELEMDAKRDEKEKHEREERRRMIEEYDEREAREAARVQAEVVQALVRLLLCALCPLPSVYVLTRHISLFTAPETPYTSQEPRLPHRRFPSLLA